VAAAATGAAVREAAEEDDEAAPATALTREQQAGLREALDKVAHGMDGRAFFMGNGVDLIMAAAEKMEALGIKRMNVRQVTGLSEKTRDRYLKIYKSSTLRVRGVG
jgi:hypothetical protein